QLSEAFPDADGTAPTEPGAAVFAAAPAVVLERDAPGLAKCADAGHGLHHPAMGPLFRDLSIEAPRRFFRIPRERGPGQVVALREDVLGLPQEGSDLSGVQLVRLRLLQDRLDGPEDRLRLLNLRRAQLDRTVDLTLLTLHREPFRLLQEIACGAVLSRGDRRLRRRMERLRLLRVRSHVPGELDVIPNRFHGLDDFEHASASGVFRALGRLDETLACGREP